MFPLRQQSVSGMDSAKYRGSINYPTFQNMDMQANLRARYINHRQVQSANGGVFSMPYQRAPITAISNSAYCYQQQNVQSSSIEKFPMPSHQRPPIIPSSNSAYIYQQQQVQSPTMENFLMPSYQNPPVVASNSEHKFQWNNSGRDMEHMSCLEILDNIKKQRAHYSRPKLQGIINRQNRTVLNTEQLFTLEKIFNRKSYIGTQELHELKEKLKISEQDIIEWFQNQRQLLGYKETGLTVSAGSSENVESKFDLEHVESIMRTPDKDGYVTLDEKAITELMTAIEEVIPDINWESLNDETANNIINYKT